MESQCPSFLLLEFALSSSNNYGFPTNGLEIIFFSGRRGLLLLYKMPKSLNFFALLVSEKHPRRSFTSLSSRSGRRSLVSKPGRRHLWKKIIITPVHCRLIVRSLLSCFFPKFPDCLLLLLCHNCFHHAFLYPDHSLDISLADNRSR